tara:strand:- start:11 stop:340 length:330 start_codon:yes stop_codon:yes gene_type:complete
MKNNPSPAAIFVVLTTVKNAPEAVSLIEVILKNKLAACINRREVKSSYLWQGKNEASNEVEIFIKTNSVNLRRLLETINNFHGYDIPEIIYWQVESTDKYSSWINEECN